MQWDKRQIGDQIIWHVNVDNTPTDESTDINYLIEVWKCFCEKIMPLYTSRPWNIIRIDFYSEHGKIIIFPEQWQAIEEIAYGVIEIHSEWYEQYACQRLFSDNPSDQKYEEIEHFEKKLAKRIGEAACHYGIAQALNHAELRLMFCMPEDIEPFEQLIVK